MGGQCPQAKTFTREKSVLERSGLQFGIRAQVNNNNTMDLRGKKGRFNEEEPEKGAACYPRKKATQGEAGNKREPVSLATLVPQAQFRNKGARWDRLRETP